MAKQKPNPFRMTTPTRATRIECTCFADPVLFLDWDEVPAEAQNEISVNGPIPCEGGGLPGEWCQDCRFGKLSDPEEL